jgi:hypothetical protein
MINKTTRNRKSINTIVQDLRRNNGKVKIGDFRDIAVRIPENINAEVAEDKSGFLFDSNTGKVFALNKTASFIFCKMKEGLSISSIVKQLTARYDIEEGIAISDIEDFLYQLREFNIDSNL